MANRHQRALKKAIRKAKEHFHGKACITSEKNRKPRDKDRALLRQGEKRAADMNVSFYPKTW